MSVNLLLILEQTLSSLPFPLYQHGLSIRKLLIQQLMVRYIIITTIIIMTFRLIRWINLGFEAAALELHFFFETLFIFFKLGIDVTLGVQSCD